MQFNEDEVDLIDNAKTRFTCLLDVLKIIIICFSYSFLV